MRPTGSAASSSASSSLSRVAFHQNRQLTRIQNGMSNGTLTADEAKGVAAKQASIADATVRALSDGKLDKAEFKQLRKMQREASRDIFEQKHNATENPVPAGERGSYIEGFQGNQSARLQKGIADGSLSAGEAGTLMDQQKRIAEAKGSAMADGSIDDTELSQLRQLQRDASVAIFKARHNDGIRA